MALRMPTMKLPRVDSSKVKLRDVELKLPDVDFKLPDFEFKRPDFEFKRPDIDLPDLSKLTLKDAGQAVGDIRDAFTGGLTAVGRGVADWRRPEPVRVERGYGAAGVSLLAGIGVGMSLMYYFDPEQGRRRRALLRDKLVRISNMAGSSLQGTKRDLGNRAGGLAATGRGVASRVSDATSDGQMESASLVAQTPDASQQLAEVDQAAPVSDQIDAGRWSGGDAGAARFAGGSTSDAFTQESGTESLTQGSTTEAFAQSSTSDAFAQTPTSDATGIWPDVESARAAGAATGQGGGASDATSDASSYGESGTGSWETGTTGSTGEATEPGPFGEPEADRDNDQEVRIRLS